MATTFNPANASVANSVDRARRLLADTGELLSEGGIVVFEFTDEEIAGWIEVDGFAEGVAKLAGSLAIKFSREPSSYADDGGLRVEFKERIAQLNKLAKDLRAQVVTNTPAPEGGVFVGGTLLNPSTAGLR
jgi:hypothetical protein